jgi:hypothetical protein
VKPKAAKPASGDSKAPKAAPRAAAANKGKAVSPEERYRMIATAAYFLAECRGFTGGYEMEDWITAELRIDIKLKS